MKVMLVPLLLALVMAGTAEGLRRAATIEAALATADEQLTTTGTTSRGADDALDTSLAIARRVPVLGARLERDVRLHRGLEAYWQRDYAALISGPLAPTTLDTDSTLLLLSANAAFRQAAARAGTPQVLARGLDDVLKGYATVLDRDPSNGDAAHNYEFVSRLRSALAGGRMNAMPEPDPQNMQGEEGEPPEGTPKSDFNVIVPLRPDERQEQLDPGAGATFQRKG